MRVPCISAFAVALGLLGCGKKSEPPQPAPVEAPPRASPELLGEYRIELGRPRSTRDETTRWCYLTISSGDEGLVVEPWHPGPDHEFTCQEVRVSPSGRVSLVVRRAQAYAARAPDLERGEISGREIFVAAEIWKLNLQMTRDAEGEVVGLKGDALVTVRSEDGKSSSFKQRFRGVRVEEGEGEQALNQWDQSRPPPAPSLRHVDFRSAHGRDRRVSKATAAKRSKAAEESAQQLQTVRAAAKPAAERAEVTVLEPARPAPSPKVVEAAPVVPPKNLFLLYALLGLIAVVCLPLMITVAVENRQRRRKAAATERIKVTAKTLTRQRRRPRRGVQAWSERLNLDTIGSAAAAQAKRLESGEDKSLWGKPGARKLQIHAASESSQDLGVVEMEELAADTPAGSFAYAPAQSRFRMIVEDAWASSEESSEDLYPASTRRTPAPTESEAAPPEPVASVAAASPVAPRAVPPRLRVSSAAKRLDDLLDA